MKSFSISKSNMLTLYLPALLIMVSRRGKKSKAGRHARTHASKHARSSNSDWDKELECWNLPGLLVSKFEERCCGSKQRHTDYREVCSFSESFQIYDTACKSGFPNIHATPQEGVAVAVVAVAVVASQVAAVVSREVAVVLAT